MEDSKIDNLKAELDLNGFLVLENALTKEELRPYARLYDDILDGQINTAKHRHDLGSHAPLREGQKENICQVMWPSKYLESGVNRSVLHQKTISLAQAILGEDMVFDFDMLISKEAGSTVETPWHQDESYWLDMPDKRALSFWYPMEDATKENGCMWFVKGSHVHEKGLREHRPAVPGKHVKMTDDCDPEEGAPYPVGAGGCTAHTGRTLHYTGGNYTKQARRAYIINCRPQAMVQFERDNNYDHGEKGLDVIFNV